jgi:hypothetical protein
MDQITQTMDLQSSALDRLHGKSPEVKQATLDAVLSGALERLKAQAAR